MNTDAPLKPSALKGIAPRVFAALERADLNARPLRYAKWLVKCTLMRGRNFLYAPSFQFLASPYGFNAKEICEILSGYDKRSDGAVRHVAGLEEIGFVQRRECALDKGWLLVVMPDASRWDVTVLYDEVSQERSAAEMDALAADFSRRLALREIDEWFPDVDKVLAEVSAENAVRLFAGGTDAPRKTDATMAGGDRASVGSQHVEPDAPRIRQETRRRCHAPFRSVPDSEKRNKRTPIDTGFSRFDSEKRNEHITVKQLNGVTGLTVQQLNSAKARGEVNRLLVELEAEFARAHGKEAARKEMVNSGGCWRKIATCWPSEFESEIGDLREFLDRGGKIERGAWFRFQFYFARTIGKKKWADVCAAAENFKESPLTHY